MALHWEKCCICGKEQRVEFCTDYVCSVCGQRYKYDEDTVIDLSDEQIGVLRQFYKSRKSPE